MSFERRDWQDYPNTSTPITADELNRLESAIDDLTHLKLPGDISSADEMRSSDYAGEYRILNTQAESLGLPTIAHGIFRVVPISGTSTDLSHTVQIWTTRDGEQWYRYILTGSGREWADWVKPTGELESKIERFESKTENVEKGLADRLRVLDNLGYKSFEIDPSGKTTIGDLEVFGSSKEFRIMDRTGAIALEVSQDGQTYIYGSNSGAGGGGSASVAEWHVFLLAGQSNMSGRGLPYSEELDPPNPRIREYGFNSRTFGVARVPLDMMDSAAGMSPATSFAREYIKNQPPNIGVVLVPAARGGTTFTTDTSALTWTPGAATNPDFALFELSVQVAKEALVKLEDGGELKGILWHQGEGNGGMSESEYASNLDNLIQSYRSEFENPSLPVVIGELSQEGNASGSKSGVHSAHKNTPARVTYTGFAPTEWGWASYDTAHLGRTGTIGLGKNYYKGYLQALGNYSGSQLLPPHNVTVNRVGDDVVLSWEAPVSRVTGYSIRYRNYKSEESWTTVSRDDDMALSETITSSLPIDIEITSYIGSDDSTVVKISA